VPNGKKTAIHVGRVTVRAGGSFRMGDAGGINAKYWRLLYRADGYGYAWPPVLLSPAEAGGLNRGGSDESGTADRSWRTGDATLR
jgi:hypothetical protein